MVMMSLNSFLGPLDSCGWEMGYLVPHIHTQVRMPESVSTAIIDVETPHSVLRDQFRRVSSFLAVYMDPKGSFYGQS